MVEPVAAGDRRPAYRDPNILRWLLAYTVSVIGDNAFFLALGWAASQITGPSEVGLVVAVGAVPRTVLMLGGGVIADRLGPRLIVIGSDAVRFMVALVAVIFLMAASANLWMLIGVALLFGIVDALFMPAVGALPPLITRMDQLVRVQGMRAFSVRLGNTVGSPLAGMMMAVGGPSMAFALVAGLFALSLMILLFVKIDVPKTPVGLADGEVRTSLRRDLLDGLRYARSRTVIRAVVITLTLVELGSVAPLNVGFLLLSNERGWGANGVGWIIGATGIGAGVGALLLLLLLLLTVADKVPRVGFIYVGSLILGSIALGFSGLAPNLAVAVVLGAVIGLMLGLNGGLAFAFIQQETEPAFLGRVMSFVGLASTGLGPLTYPAFGSAVAAVGVGPTFLVFAAVSLLGTVFSWTILRRRP